jgi:predicted RND superfamily exporter protein
MKRFYQVIVNNPKKILVAFILLSVLGAVLRGMVPVNYDMADYLPEESPSTVALDVMGEEFDGGIPNACVMVQNVTIAEALEYKARIEDCPGVSSVTWLDDATDILQPIETMDVDTVETYYKDNAALFTVTVEDEKQVEAVEAIRDIIGDENAMTGEAVSTAVATTGTVSEITKITVIAILFVFFVLILTTTSWMEPILVMVGLGVAVLINSGSNLIFGEISFVTNAAGMILQIAVSLDYSVFLIHRFEACLRETSDSKTAMVEALCKSTSSILSSGLTTVIGFLALLFMRFRIGPDLGRALAKGIAISLITVFIFMPALILSAQKWLTNTKHRSFLPSFKGFGKLIRRVMIPMACLFLVLIIPSYLASNANDFYYSSSHIYGEGTLLGDDTVTIEEHYGKSDTYVAMVPRGDLETEKRLSDALHNIPQVKNILSYVDTVGAEIPMEYLDSDTLSQLVSDEYSRFVITVDADYESKQTFLLVENIRDVLKQYYPDTYYLAGSGVTAYDLMDTITADTSKVNLIAISAVFLVLLLTMKSISLPVILVLAIETAVWLNVSIPYFEGNTVFYISYLIISSVQLGATVDYAILFTERYCELRSTLHKKQAVIETVAAVTPSLLTSGTVLAVVGFLLGRISSHGVLAQLGMFVGVGSLFSLATVLFVLPGFLYLLDALIQHTTLKLKFINRSKEVVSE